MIAGFTTADVPDQRGKTYLVTGANTGIGFETAKALASRGAKVLLGCRGVDRGRAAVARIVADHPEAAVEVVALDLGDLGSVRAAAEVVGREARLDGLINNAGIMATPRTITVDGFEAQLGVNHLGHFALTGLLLPRLQATPGARVVTVSSIAHRNGSIFFDDLDGTASYSPWDRYGQSKLANLLFTHELDRRLDRGAATTIAVAAHPGLAATDLARNMARLTRLVTPIASLLFNSAAQGAWPTLAAATHTEVEGGLYLGPGGFRELRGPATIVEASPASKDPATAARLWDLSIELTAVDPGI